MRLQVVRAIYKDGTLIFSHPELAPGDGTEVLVTYLGEARAEEQRGMAPIQALRGRGKGERLVERLLQSRQEDREHNGSGHGHIRA